MIVYAHVVEALQSASGGDPRAEAAFLRYALRAAQEHPDPKLKAAFVEALVDEPYQEWGWNLGYLHPGNKFPDDSPQGLGVRAIKRELKWLGFDNQPVKMIDNGYYGTNMFPNVIAFQESLGWESGSGVIGPQTMEALCHKRIENFTVATDTQVEIPDKLLCRQAKLETEFCPWSHNSTDDWWVCQIHSPLNARFPSDGKPVCADDAGVIRWPVGSRIGKNIRYLAEVMRQNHHNVAPFAQPDATPEQIWRAAVFAYNAPAWAGPWLAAGLPATGGEVLAQWMQDLFDVTTRYEWATLYCKVVYARSC